jgi:hypothetical protein
MSDTDTEQAPDSDSFSWHSVVDEGKALVHGTEDAASNLYSNIHDALHPNPNGPGNPDPDAINQALGHYAETPVADTPEEAAKKSDEMNDYQSSHPNANSSDLASVRVNQSHEGVISNTPGDTKLDLSSADARVKTLASLTQNSSDPRSTYECGEAAVTGGMLLAKGAQGGGQLANDIMQKDLAGDPSKLDQRGKLDMMLDETRMAVIQAKVAGGMPLTVDDAHNMDTALYDSIKLQDQGVSGDQMHKDAAAGSHDATVQPKDLKKFLDEHPDVAGTLKANGMQIEGIYTTGEKNPKGGLRPANHAVLQIGNDSVYDPYARKNGQIINSSNKDELRDYKDSEVAPLDTLAAQQ